MFTFAFFELKRYPFIKFSLCVLFISYYLSILFSLSLNSVIFKLNLKVFSKFIFFKKYTVIYFLRILSYVLFENSFSWGIISWFLFSGEILESVLLFLLTSEILFPNGGSCRILIFLIIFLVTSILLAESFGPLIII